MDIQQFRNLGGDVSGDTAAALFAVGVAHFGDIRGGHIGADRIRAVDAVGKGRG